LDAGSCIAELQFVYCLLCNRIAWIGGGFDERGMLIDVNDVVISHSGVNDIAHLIHFTSGHAVPFVVVYPSPEP
jgi:hypothetical protein